jgi:hypothetical protein
VLGNLAVGVIVHRELAAVDDQRIAVRLVADGARVADHVLFLLSAARDLGRQLLQ